LEILENDDDCRKAIRNDLGMVLLFPNDLLIFLNAVGEDTDHGVKSEILPQPSNEKRALIRHCEKTP